MTGSPIKEWAESHHFPVMEWDKARTDELYQKIAALQPDLFIVTSFGVILRKEWLVLPKIAPVNLHASILPQYRGASPMQMAILNGDAETGVSVMRMVSKCDAGDVMKIKRIPINDTDTTPTLEAKLSRAAAEVLTEALPILADGKAVWQAQDEGLSTRCSKIEKSQGQIDWKKSAAKLDREIRAFHGWPGSYFFYQGKRIHVGEAKPRISSSAPHSAGKILGVSPDGGLLVACGESSLELKALQLEGRKMLPTADFLRGFNLKAGDFLE